MTVPPETIDEAYEAARQTIIDALVDNAVDANIAGQVKAGLLMKMPLDFNLVSSRALAAVIPYRKMLTEQGGSVIQGGFVPWLDDMIARDREQVGEIVNTAIREGTPLRDVSKALDQVFAEQEHNATLTAFQETKRIYTQGTFQRYRDEEITRGIWRHLDPQLNPREEHQARDGQVFDLSDPIWQELEDYNCHCWCEPIIEGRTEVPGENMFENVSEANRPMGDYPGHSGFHRRG